jgi:hypothetical protein
MSKSNATENDYVKFEANAVAMPAYGANLQINLHTADPGEAGNSDTSAPTYTGYLPVTKSRDAAGFTICDGTNPYAANAAGPAYKNASDVIFPEATGGSDTITHVSVSLVGAAQQILRSTALTAPLNVSNGITPLFLAGTLVWAED